MADIDRQLYALLFHPEVAHTERGLEILRNFAYGISAPSSVLIDMLCADVPTAIWCDREGLIDTSNYPGLTQVSDARQWREFALQAVSNPEPFVRLQRQFLADQKMPIEPAEVFRRYAEVFQAAERMSVRTGNVPVDRLRLLLVANAHLPTVQVCLEYPLQSPIRRGEVVTELLTETRLGQVSRRIAGEGMENWISQALDHFAPDVVIFSRYSGPFSSEIVRWARSRSVPVIYHIDDDLLGVPRDLGDRKFAYHNAPERLSTVRSLLQASDLVYTSTEVLRQRLLSYYPGLHAVAGQINACGQVRKRPRGGAARIVGYVASADHFHNLEMVLPAIAEVLDQNPSLCFELFGSIPIPQALLRFGSRVRQIPPVANYEHFLEALCERDWDIGICPLVPTDFNRAKSNNKWVEYTSAGIAVVASAGMVYDGCCSGGCGELAADLDEWRAALERLVVHDGERIAMVERAQRHLESDYGIAAHHEQIMGILRLAIRQSAGELIEEHA